MSKIKLRVVPFGFNNERYKIEYKLYWFSFWTTLTEAWLTESIALCTLNQPVLFLTHDGAVRYAKRITREWLTNYYKGERASYNNHIKKLKESIKNRNKITYL